MNEKPDEHPDLDLYLVTTDEAYDDFVSKRESFVHLLGDPLFNEDFDVPNFLFPIFANGAEVEIHYVRETLAANVFNEPYNVVLDKKNISADIVLEKREVNRTEQTEKLRRIIYWFWHDFSHFITAMGRDQLW